MNDFSAVGPTSADGWVKPDLVTSGRSVVSLAAPGSTIDTDNPSARIGSANFVGSGTSFSAAITSGAAALVLADNPGLTPNQLKARLLGTTSPGPVGNPFVDGHGALNAYAAATSGPMNLNQSTVGLLPTLAGTAVSLAPTRPGRHLEREPVVRDSPGISRLPLVRRGTDGRGTAQTGTGGSGPAGLGMTAGGPAPSGTAQPGLAGPGTTEPGPARPGPARPGLALPGPVQHGTDPGPTGSQAMKMLRATWAIIAVAVAGGAFVLFFAGWRQSASGHVNEGQWVVAAAIGVLALGSWVWPVVVYRGVESEAFNMDEGFFVILALLVPPLLVLGTLALATVVAQAARRRPVVKSAFNAGQVLIAAGLGLAVSRSIAGPARFPYRRPDRCRLPRGGSVLRRQFDSRGRR